MHAVKARLDILSQVRKCYRYTLLLLFNVAFEQGVASHQMGMLRGVIVVSVTYQVHELYSG